MSKTTRPINRYCPARKMIACLAAISVQYSQQLGIQPFVRFCIVDCALQIKNQEGLIATPHSIFKKQVLTF